MLARSRMGGPWSRAQQIARAFLSRGHEVMLAWGDDGNCVDPVAPTFEIPVPSPLGLPEAIARHTFPLASRLGLMGRKPVHSFEEVLWLTGSLDYSCAVVEALREFMRTWRPDVVYSEFNLAAVIAARAEGIPCVGSGSQPTTAAYASNPRKSAGIRRLLREMGMPAPASSLTILEGMKRRFIPSSPSLEPEAGERAIYCGFLGDVPKLDALSTDCDCTVVYLGSGSVPAGVAVRVGRQLSSALGCDVYVAGVPEAVYAAAGREVHCAPRLNFAELLPRARVLVHHGGQNSMMDALAYEVPQVVVPGRVFERQFNAEAVERTRCGLSVRAPKPALIVEAALRLVNEASLSAGLPKLRDELSALGGTERIVSEVEAIPYL